MSGVDLWWVVVLDDDRGTVYKDLGNDRLSFMRKNDANL
jgi:hypothetical protein